MQLRMEVLKLLCMSFKLEHYRDINPSMCRDEWNKGLDQGMDFDDFFPSWRNTVFWEQWKKYARMCFGTGLTCFFLIYHHLMDMTADDDRKAVKDRSKSIKTPVEIITDVDGEPEIPSITKDDGYQAKVVQVTLRKYCAAHIREFYLCIIQEYFTYAC